MTRIVSTTGMPGSDRGGEALLPTPSWQRGPAIALDKVGGDVWVWEKRLSGVCPGCPPEATIALEIGERSFPARRAGDAFSASVRFEPGPNEVVAVATRADGSRVVSVPVAYDVKLRPRPVARLTPRIEGGRVVFDASGSNPSDYDNSPLVSSKITPRGDNPAALALTPDGPGASSAAIPAIDGEYYADLLIVDAAGRTDRAAACFVVEGGVASVPDPERSRAGWISPAVVYGVVPRNFDPPTFAGVAARLDDLRDLGITALWFSPITRTPAGDFGYAVTDYFQTNPTYGTVEEFRALVDAAHARGIRVLMDFVPNHTSDEHPYAQAADVFGDASDSWDFYQRDPAGNPAHYFDWRHLPNLNYDNPEVRRFMQEAMTFWVRDVGIDGFRVDAVWGIARRRPGWLVEVLAEIYRIKPDALVVAEASARDALYFDLGFDAAYDWTGELGHWAWGEVFGGDAPFGQAMVEALTGNGQGYHPDALVMRFLNNNDTGPRFVTTHGIDCYKAALAMLLTLPGLPCLFTGDEVAAEFEPYRTVGPIDRTDRHDLRPFVQHAIAARRDHPALHSRRWLPLVAEPTTPLFAYLRYDDRGGASPVLVAINPTGAETTATISLPVSDNPLWAGPDLADLLGGEPVSAPAGNALDVSVPAWGARVLTDVRG